MQTAKVSCSIESIRVEINPMYDEKPKRKSKMANVLSWYFAPVDFEFVVHADFDDASRSTGYKYEVASVDLNTYEFRVTRFQYAGKGRAFPYAYEVATGYLTRDEKGQTHVTGQLRRTTGGRWSDYFEFGLSILSLLFCVYLIIYFRFVICLQLPVFLCLCLILPLTAILHIAALINLYHKPYQHPVIVHLRKSIRGWVGG
jgi:hypothetical protein